MSNALHESRCPNSEQTRRHPPRRQIGGAFACPSYLLFDITTAWAEAPTRAAAAGRVAMYLLTPHNYLALALVCRFSERGARLAHLSPSPSISRPGQLYLSLLLLWRCCVRVARENEVGA